MAWLNLSLEIGEQFGVELTEEAIGRIEDVRDLLREVNEARGGGRPVDLEGAPERTLSQAQRRWLEPLPAPASWLSRGIFGLNWALMRGLFRLRIEGLEHLPQEDQILLTPSHASFLDPFLIGAALPYGTLRRAYWGGWTGVAFSNPINRAFSRLAQVVPIDPDQGMISSLAFGAAALKRGRSLVWFPEGGRSTTGALQEFKQGVALLAQSFPVWVVPAAVSGAHEAMPPGRVVPTPLHRIDVLFGEPVTVATLEAEGEGADSRERIVHALRARVQRLTGEP
jgi:long-chain acyl-CoA synthetase